MTDGDAKPTCFIAMPMTTRPQDAAAYGDDDHWNHVIDYLFVPAIEEAGMRPIKPLAQGSTMIHAGIIENLEQADMVLCDMSGENPNVFFELGIRTSLDRPIAIVKDNQSKIPFDLGGLNTLTYASHLNVWALTPEIERIAAHLLAAQTSCAGSNPLWKQYGLTKRATTPESDESPAEAKLDLLFQVVNQIDARISQPEQLGRMLEVEFQNRERNAKRLSKLRRYRKEIIEVIRANSLDADLHSLDDDSEFADFEVVLHDAKNVEKSVLDALSEVATRLQVSARIVASD